MFGILTNVPLDEVFKSIHMLLFYMSDYTVRDEKHIPDWRKNRRRKTKRRSKKKLFLIVANEDYYRNLQIFKNI